MGRCRVCGVNYPYIPDGGTCNNCRDAERSKNLGSQSGNSTTSSTNYDNIKLTPGVAKAVRLMLIVVIIAAIVGIVSYMYSSNGSRFDFEEITETLSAQDADGVVTEILGREDNVTNWEVSISDYKNDFFSTLFKLEDCSADIERYVQKDGTEIIAFDFDGNDLGTGLKGEYRILTIEGKLSVLDEKAELIYQEGSEFFDTYYPRLSALTYDALVKPMAEKAVGGQYGKNKQGKLVLQSDGAQMLVCDEKRVEFVVEADGGHTVLVAEAYEDDAITFEMRNYKLYGEDYENLDELGKLMADGDYSVSIEKYVDGEEVFDLRYERNLKEHSIEFEEDYGDLKKGTYFFTLGEDTIVHKVYNSKTYDFDETTISAAENNALYNALSALVPENYVRNVVDLGKANKSGALGVDTYTMKDADGNKIATLSVAFGKINKLIHFVSGSERIEMSW